MRWASAVLLSGALASCIVINGYDFGGYRSTEGAAGAAGAAGGGQAGTPIGRDAAGDGPICIPVTCADLHAECGKVPDGCDGVLDCGGCEVGLCGGNGRNRCGTEICIGRTCADLGAGCGEISDDCGGTVQCGRCVPPETCGGGGMSTTD